MLEHYALEEDPLEAFKQRQSRLEQVSPQLPSVGGGCHRQFPRLLKAEPWSSLSPLPLCDLEQLPSLSHHPSQGAFNEGRIDSAACAEHRRQETPSI